jgi:hypothetical protein
VKHQLITLLLAAVLAIGLDASGATPESTPAEGNRIDAFVFAKLQKLGIPPSGRCSDAVFLRRVYLDVIGTLPTATEARHFLDSRDFNKRAALIDKLLEHDAFADYWAMKWYDLLRIKSEFPSKLWPNAVQAYARWIRTAIKNNMPYDRFARALLTSSGSNFREAPVNFYRAMPEKTPMKIAETVALTFMGVRTRHWSENQRLGMAAFFGNVGFKGTSEWKEEIVYFNPDAAFLNPSTKLPHATVFPDGKRVSIPPGRDPRIVFADWLIRPENPWFTRAIVNRAWYWLLGRGLIHEPDDIRANNPCRNPELLAWLEKELVRSKYDLKHIFRLILSSRTYQLSSVCTKGNRHDQNHFSHYRVRQLKAEVLIDAICQITGTTEHYHSKVPEPFTFIPETHRSITLADGSISSPFLEMFGRPPRDTGLESERRDNPSPNQRLHLLNSTHIQKKILKSRKLKALLKRLAKKDRRGEAVVRELYLTILSRYPSAAEIKTIQEYAAQKGVGRYHAAFDLAWALMNTKEFLCHH